MFFRKVGHVRSSREKAKSIIHVNESTNVVGFMDDTLGGDVSALVCLNETAVLLSVV